MATTTRIKLTSGRIESSTCPEGKQQQFFRDSEQPGLALRVTASGNKGYVYEGKLAGSTVRLTIGDTNTLTLSQARDRAAEIRGLIRSGRDPRVLKAESLAADAHKRESEKEARKSRAEASKHTLEKLLLAYCDYLQKLGRTSHKDARSIFTLHVIDSWPKIAQAPAAALSPEQVADMMRRLLDVDKGRTANKLRSYVRAAFQVAKDARFDARIPVAFKDFKVSINPAAETVPDSTRNRPGKDPLSQDMLIAYWGLIKDAPGLRGALLRLHLLTGGQRIAQLVRLLTVDITPDNITLYDGKGRPGAAPRPHLLPLIPQAKKALEAAASGGEYALSTDGGRTHVSASTLTKWAQEIVGDQIPGFTGKRIRSGVETLLSKFRISKDVRGRLQSHGITGVQDRHYDGHDYLPEKRNALMALYRALEQKKATVTPIRSNAA